MAKRFENKKLNKEDHKQIEKDADVVKKGLKFGGILAGVVITIKKVPWHEIFSAVQTAAKIFKA